MNLSYRVDDVNTRDHRAVAYAIVRWFHAAFPDDDSFYIPRLVTDVKNMFEGNYENLQPIDTKYHDLEHTLQASLCLTRNMVLRNLTDATPKLTAHDMKLGIVAIMLHDTGYLKRSGDEAGTGAKYTKIHEKRSCEYTAHYLSQFGWDARDIAAVQHMISCTGPFSDISAVPFESEIECLLGKAVCTADYVGQMSDPLYVGKLSHLYQEFEESDNHNNIPLKNRAFKSFRELLEKTPAFWEKIVQPRLHVECENLWRFLAYPYPDGINPYFEAIEKNIQIVKSSLDNEEVPEQAQARA